MKLLVITPFYNSFVKDQIEELSSYFETINVMVRYNPITKLSELFPLNFMKPFNKKRILDLEGIPENVHVHITPVIYLPIDFIYRKLGKLHLRSVMKLIKKENMQFDLIHCHFIWSSGFVGIKLKDLYKVPLVITAHGFDVYSLPFKSNKWLNIIRSILNNADKIITVSLSNLKVIQKFYDKENISIIPNGYSEELFFPFDKIIARNKLKLPLNKKILLSVGHLIPIKGHYYLINALAKLDYQNIYCIIIGDGSEKNKLKKLVVKYNLESHVLFTGYLPHKELNIWLNAADLFVFPSLRESFGVVQIEALAAGVPVVATINGGSENIISSKKIGLLSIPKNDKDLANSIKKALNFKWDRNYLIEYASNFKWKRICKKIMKIYRDLLQT